MLGAFCSAYNRLGFPPAQARAKGCILWKPLASYCSCILSYYLKICRCCYYSLHQHLHLRLPPYYSRITFLLLYCPTVLLIERCVR